MRLATEYLSSPRGRVSLLVAVCAVAVAFAVLGVGLTAPAGQRGASIVLSGLALLAGELAFAVGAGSALRARRAELATLRALGWRQRQVRGQLMLSFGVIAVAAGVPALVATLAVTALLGGGRAQAGLALLSLPGMLGMVVAAAWWPVRRATGERQPARPSQAGRLARGRRQERPARPAGPGRQAGSDRWESAREVARNLLRKPIRTAAGALVIATASVAVGVELAIYCGGPSWAGQAWLGRPASWQVSAIDVAAVVVIAVVAAGTVADLDRLAARERAVESSTLRALGWPALRMARLAAGEAVLLGAIAGVIDMVGGVALAHQALTRQAVTPGVVGWVAGVAFAAGAAGVMISLLAAAVAALIGRQER
jgi:hypothetical protein